MINYEQIRLGSEIREVRKARGLTLNNLSAKLSCSTAYLSRIERGPGQVTVSVEIKNNYAFMPMIR